MKLQIKLLIATLAIAGSAAYLIAQDTPDQAPHRAGPGGGFGPRGHMPPPPVIAVLDANHDGVIDSTEIDNAPAALRTLDKNGDGKLTPDEVRPPHPQGRGFRHGAGGPPNGQDAPPAAAPQAN